MNNLAFCSDLIAVTNRVSKSCFVGAEPTVLYHYTKENSAKSIIRSQSFWATALTEQSDGSELTHGIILTEQIIAESLTNEANPFVRSVLTKVPSYLQNRKPLVFIICFCGTADSPFHRERYGKICFEFSSSVGRMPALTTGNARTETWFTPVLYGELEQKAAITDFLNDVKVMLKKHSSGKPQDDRRGFIASTPTRDIGQCLLTLIASFKQASFRDDNEWRMIFAPKLALSSSAPSLIDEEFSVQMKDLPRRHIVLRRNVPFIPGKTKAWPPPTNLAPYDRVHDLRTVCRHH